MGLGRRLLPACLGLGMALLASVPANAGTEELVIGMSRAVTSIDPHFQLSAGNISVAAHLFDRLVHQDERQRLIPGLALSWRAVEPTVWEFKLRPGVRFHDGSPFEAEDVVASFARASGITNSPSPVSFFTRPIVSVEPVDAMTVRFTTRHAQPLFPVDVGFVSIVPRHQRGATTAAFDAGTATIGTGPYRLVSWQRDSELVLERNEHWWSDPGPWARVRKRIMVTDPSRVAALLAGDVQVIETVPSGDVGRLAADDRFTIVRRDANRVMFLALDQHRAVTPFATTRDDRPLAGNPLLDLRVRRAISKAINRPALVATTMDGTATAAGTLISPLIFEGAAELPPDEFDPKAARALLAEAGYPDGFALTLHGPNDRYPNDDRVLLAIGQMLTRVGIQARIVTMPFSVFGARATRMEFSVMLNGFVNNSAGPITALRHIIATADRERGFGANNRGGYSNPAFDRLVERSLTMMDETARTAAIMEAARIAADDMAIVPLYFKQAVWGLGKGVKYDGRVDEQTQAWAIRRGP